MKTKEYLKYYWLEKYLEDEVQPFFEKHGYLGREQFFMITEWKSRFAKVHLKYLGEKDVETLTRAISSAVSTEERLRILLKESDGKNRKGIRLAMASAILTILYPTEFTVYDIRVRSLFGYSDITNDKSVVEKYFNEYLPKIKAVASENKMTLRDCDRALWAKSWHEDLQKFLGFLR